MSEVEEPTENHLCFGKACFGLELVSCVHAFAGNWSVGMEWSSRCVDCQECCCLPTGDVVGTWDVDSEANDVVDVDVVRSLGVNGDVDNQLSTCSEGNIGLKESMFGDQMLVWGEKLTRFPVIAEQDGIRQVANCLGDDSPLERTGFSAEAEPKHHQEYVNFH